MREMTKEELRSHCNRRSDWCEKCYEECGDCAMDMIADEAVNLDYNLLTVR